MVEHLNQVGHQNILAIIGLAIAFGLLLSAQKQKLSKLDIAAVIVCLAYFAYAWNSIKVVEKIDNYQLPLELSPQR
jgi:hypothetical protein